MTRLCVFSDVHGNSPALEAFLATDEARDADLLVNLGDIASGAVDPRGTLDILAGHPEILTVAGNHERQLLDGRVHQPGSVDDIAAAVLTQADREWMQGLPLRLEVAPGVLAFHATPDNDVTYLLETITPDAGESALREATDDEVIQRLGDWRSAATIFLSGHTHLQRTRRLPGGGVVVNPGSLGWPAFSDNHIHPHRVEAGTPHARFSVVDVESSTVTHHAIEYDVARAAALAERNGRADVARALRSGGI